MTKHPRHMKFSELCFYSKTPSTTIRYYIREGLLPQPLKTAKTMAYYTGEHLDRLLSIKKLKEEGKETLESIKKILGKSSRKPAPPKEAAGELLTSTRDEIVRNGIDLFRRKGYDAIKISDIVSSSGIGKGTFYQYFKNKEELFFECLDSIFYDVGKDVPEVQEETDGLKRLRKRSRHFNQHHSHLMRMLNIARRASFTNNPLYKEKLDQAMRNFIEPIKKDIELILIQRGSSLTNSALLAHLFMGAAEYAYYLVRYHNANFKKVDDEFWKYFFGADALAESRPGR